MFFSAQARPGETFFSELKTQIREKYEELGLKVPDLAPLEIAFKIAQEAHAGQTRESGPPYINHPLEIALEMVKDGWLEIPSLTAIIPHDSIEETAEAREPITVARIKGELGDEVAKLVDGLTKLRKLGRSKTSRNIESFKKFVDFGSQDIRVVILKLYDRLINSRTFDKLPPDRARKNAVETLEVYVPLAYGLGLWDIKNELEENSWRILDNKGIDNVRDMIARESKRVEDNRSADDVLAQVKSALSGFKSAKKKGVKIDYVPNSASHIYRLLKEEEVISVEDELHTFVIEVKEKNCHSVLGVLHGMYSHVPETFEDFISNPRPNLYRALHTIVYIPGIGNVMFKIMSPKMRILAEAGILHGYSPLDQHWYKFFGDKYPWFEEVVAYVKEEGIYSESEIRGLMQRKVFSIQVITDRGEFKRIPRGSTTRDFAYAIHTELGHEAVVAKIHRRKRTLVDSGMTIQVEPFDRIEIFRQPGRRPTVYDLNEVNTPDARSAIRAYLRTLPPEDSEKMGREILAQALESEWELEFKTGRTKKIEKVRCFLKPEDLGAAKEFRGSPVRIFETVFKRLRSQLKGRTIENEKDIFHLVGIGEIPIQAFMEQLLKFILERRREKEKSRLLEIEFRIKNRIGITRDISKAIAELRLDPEEIRVVREGKTALGFVKVRIYSNIDEIQIRNIIADIEMKEGGS
jgi:(p)ppGpp synthase/HD superfamily hydrolase